MIRAGALVAVNYSGGKDSQAMTILLSRIVPRAQLVAVHAPLGEVEWEDIVPHVEATLPAGVPLIMAPVSSGKTLLDSIEEGQSRASRSSPCRFPGARRIFGVRSTAQSLANVMSMAAASRHIFSSHVPPLPICPSFVRIADPGLRGSANPAEFLRSSTCPKKSAA